MSKGGHENGSDGGILIAAQNRKARHDYEILETEEAGVVLKGHEVKSVREGGVNLRDSYVRVLHGEIFLVGCHINPYSFAREQEQEPVRDRKLLLHRKQIEKLAVQVSQKGLTLIPLKLYFKNGRCKLEIGVARGKKLHDKRQDTKRREADRKMLRALSRD